ncbi:MAG: SMC-Scp complex subunit ScpB [Candidatus Aenigmarchaeota archaeon]|nr:SMC-Scp complex subunit ScpB [Candidatus Aenigmarchaeota archaeon]
MIESILLAAEKPVSIKELASVSGFMMSEVQKTVLSLIEEYKEKGIRIIRKGEYIHLVSAPCNAEFVAKYLNEELRADLSQQALETLAIITYKQPITRIEIEEVRGVNCEQILRSLLIRGLITEVDRRDTVGRPILYGTTMEFMQYFGLENESQLPKIDDSQEILRLEGTGEKPDIIIEEKE